MSPCKAAQPQDPEASVKKIYSREASAGGEGGGGTSTQRRTVYYMEAVNHVTQE